MGTTKRLVPSLLDVKALRMTVGLDKVEARAFRKFQRQNGASLAETARTLAS